MKVGVVGAGLMGAEIALVYALGGHEVLLNDRDANALDRAVARLASLTEKGVARGLYQAEQRERALASLTLAPDLSSFADCGLVTEAVVEVAEVKAAVLQALDAVCADGCFIASNTSTIPISTLAASLSPARRGRFLGTHFFSPVSRMPLVEVVAGFETDPATLTEVARLLQQIGKHPIQVKDVPGFAVNRLLHAMIIEAVRLVEEGVATPEDLDSACRLGLGHPIGPFALMDNVTSRLCLQVQEILHDSYGERFRPPALLKQRVSAGFVGGRGQPGWLTPAQPSAPPDGSAPTETSAP